MATTLAVKVDVDTDEGTRKGVPRLLDILRRRRVHASFYLSLGPDRSGRAVLRAFTRRGFLSKMIRTRAPQAYGLKTMCYGTLLPAPVIGRGLEALAGELADAGHEVGLHAWDHVTWHDRLWKMTPGDVEAEVGRGVEAFTRLTGRPPKGFAAPAWRINYPACRALAAAGVAYLSATRGTGPYWPVFDGRPGGLLEIPTTLPTADEVLGRNGLTPANIDRFFLQRLRPGLNVITVHAEMEGRTLAEAFDRFLAACVDRGVAFRRLVDVAGQFPNPADPPACQVDRLEIDGRAGRVCCQGS
jgi:peptidoglycan/xylan/chitin deacetylase (PgdA/CDA1 family)